MAHHRLIILILIVLLLGCGGAAQVGTEPLAVEVVEPELGELEKDGDFTYGEPYMEWVRVSNCGNPLPRSDWLRESRGVEKNIEWSVEGELGGFAGAGTGIEGKIAMGYQLEVSEQIERGREIELPVQAFSSVEYPIRWQTLVWSGWLPFKLSSAEGRIRYFYTRHLFGEVVPGFKDRTLEDCGSIPTPTAGPIAEQPVQEPPAAPPQPLPAATDTPGVKSTQPDCPSLANSHIEQLRAAASVSDALRQAEEFANYRQNDYQEGTTIPAGVVIATDLQNSNLSAFPVAPIRNQGGWGLFFTTNAFVAPNAGTYWCVQ